MGDVEADLDRIREAARRMRRVKRTFDDHSNPAEGYTAQAFGTSKLTDAFDDFSSNWKVHREKLVEQLDGLAKQTSSAAKGFDEVDTKLANALRQTDRKKGA